MISMGNEYQLEVDQNLNVLIRATITNTNGSPQSRTITNGNIIDRQFSYTDSCSQQDKLELGSCVINQLTMTINNPHDLYGSFQYAGATVVVEMGRKVNGTATYFQKGVYYVISDGYYGDTVTLTCYDSFVLWDVPFDSSLFFDDNGDFIECTVLALFNELKEQMGVTLNWIPTNSTTLVKNAKALRNVTCRELLYYICQIEGCYARYNRLGNLEIKSHKFGVSLLDNDIDGTVYVIDSYNKGNLVMVSGVKLSNIADAKDYKTCGNSLYTLLVDGNPLIGKSNKVMIANTIQSKISNKYILPYNCMVAPNELLEAGDKIYIVDASGQDNAKISCATNIEYTLGEPMFISMGAETLEQNKENRGISQIEQIAKLAHDNMRAVTSIARTENASGQITQLKYTYNDDSNLTVAIEYDTNGNITKFGGTTIL